jgi:hypothetical protein
VAYSGANHLGDGLMSNYAGNIISLDRLRAPGTYAEALLEQSHRKEAVGRSAEFVYYGWSANENVICSKTTHGILESVINPSTMEVIHYWAKQGQRVLRLVKGTRCLICWGGRPSGRFRALVVTSLISVLWSAEACLTAANR